MFGQFHIEGSIFSGIGKLLEGSGGPYFLSEAGVVDMGGSLNRFLKGKMYNRCRRGHLLLSSALHGLHFNRFVEDLNIGNEIIVEIEAWDRLDSEMPTQELLNISSK